MAPADLTVAEVERLARSVLGSTGVAVRRSLPGYGNQSWRIDGAGGRGLVLKVGRLSSGPKWRSAHRALALAAAEGIPVPDLVHDGQHGDHLVRVFTWVDGTNAKEADLDADQEHRFLTSLGRAVATLHRVQLDGFSSRLDGSAPAFPRWGDYLLHRFGEIRERCRAVDAVEADVLERVHSALAGLIATIDDAAEPVLCHRDLHPGNLILGPDGSVAGIIDWDMAEPWDRAGDWFKLEYEVLRTRPAGREVLEAAYLDGGPIPDRWPERRRAVHLVETLNILPNAITQAWSTHYATRARHHLESLLTP